MAENKKKYDVALYGATMGANYGGLITYYALYKAVEKMGYSIGLVPPPLPRDGKITQTHARRFCADYMNITEGFLRSKMRNLNPVADTFLLGSDQIWNYTLFPGRRETLYLDFVKDSKKKIAYAASFGFDKPTIFPDYPERYPKIMPAMNRLDAVGVREANGVDICNDYYSTKATHVMDPVFLLNQDDYKELADKAENKPEGKYMCVYALSPKDDINKVFRSVSKELNLPRVNMASGNPKKFESKKKNFDMPYCENLQMEEWLYNIMNSDFVVTDSYHCVCFSIIFRKQFVLIQERWAVARIESLLDKLGLKGRWFDNYADFMAHKEVLEQKIDYDEVYKKLEKEIEFSHNWLKDALASKKKVHCMNMMQGDKVDNSAYARMYAEKDAKKYTQILDGLKKDLIIMMVKKGVNDSAITKVKFFKEGGIGPITKEKMKSKGFAYIYDFANGTILKELQNFSYATYDFNGTKLTCYSEGKAYEMNEKKTAEFIIEQGDRKDIYTTDRDGLYTLVYSKKENRVIDYAYVDISEGSELQVEHLIDESK